MSVVSKRICDLCMTPVSQRHSVSKVKLLEWDVPSEADICNECEDKPIEMLLKILRKPR